MLGKFDLVTAQGVAVLVADPMSNRWFIVVDVITLVFWTQNFSADGYSLG